MTLRSFVTHVFLRQSLQIRLAAFQLSTQLYVPVLRPIEVLIELHWLAAPQEQDRVPQCGELRQEQGGC